MIGREDWAPMAAPAGWTQRPLAGVDGHAYRLLLAAAPSETPLPAVFVLDGGSHFPIMAGAVAALARRTSKTGVPPMAVIGLAHAENGGEGRRAFDFTDGPPDDPSAPSQAGGGAAALLDLIANRALPMAAAAGVDLTRLALFSHSLGALFGLYALGRRPDLFAAWSFISPSLWWRPGLAAEAAEAVRGRDASVYLAWGEREAGGPEGRAMGPRAASALAAFKAVLGEARVDGGEIAGEDHGSCPIAACPAALRLFGAQLGAWVGNPTDAPPRSA